MLTVTADSPKTAKAITDALLKGRLAACVNEMAGIKSSYWWKGKLERSREIMLVIKTRKTLAADVIREVKKVHPYEVPEIIAFDISRGNPDYLEWIGKETKK